MLLVPIGAIEKLGKLVDAVGVGFNVYIDHGAN